MTPKKKRLVAVLVALLLVGAGAAFWLTKGDAEEVSSASDGVSASPRATPSPAPSVVPLVLNATATGGEGVASVAVTASRAVTGQVVFQAAGQQATTKVFATSQDAPFKATVEVKGLKAGVYAWVVTVAGDAATVTGSVTVTAPTPKADVCPNGDYTGSQFDGKCGTKPAPQKDYCPNGDYTGSRYDGRCGNKPAPPQAKDNCPNGDYSGSSYDGKCGTKPAPKPTNPGGGKCPSGYTYVPPGHGFTGCMEDKW